MPAELDTATMIDLVTSAFGRRARPAEPLARHGTFGVGGPADVFVSVTSEAALLDLVTLANHHGWPLMLVGNGTNALFADAGARGLVARMAIDGWEVAPVEDGRVRLTAGGGVNLPKLVNDLADRGLAGIEWGAGVPGTIGGAVVSNAGAHGQCVADNLESVRVLLTHAHDTADPEVVEQSAPEAQLAYRHSRFRAERRIAFDADERPISAPRERVEPPEMIVSATFLLTRDEPERVWERVRAYRQHRKDTQPPQPSAGSVFKNPPGDYSGRLVEACGLKGTQIGGAQISPKHANFIVNTGGATAADITGLIALARRTVRERFGVALELEVEFRGDW